MAWWHQPITQTNVNLTTRSHVMHLRAFLQKDLWILIASVKRDLNLYWISLAWPTSSLAPPPPPHHPPPTPPHPTPIPTHPTPHPPTHPPPKNNKKTTYFSTKILLQWRKLIWCLNIHSYFGHCYLTYLVLRPEYSRLAGSIQWLLIFCFLQSPGHQQLIYWYSNSFMQMNDTHGSVVVMYSW